MITQIQFTRLAGDSTDVIKVSVTPARTGVSSGGPVEYTVLPDDGAALTLNLEIDDKIEVWTVKAPDQG